MEHRSAPRQAAFAHVEAWVFDLDNTLYPARHSLFAQVDVRMGEYLSRLLALEVDAARAVQKSLFRRHGSTLRGLMSEYGIEPDGFLEYVHDVDFTVLPRDERLDRALSRLAGRKLVFTSASLDYAEKALERIGVAHHFEAVFDITAADYLPKPHPPTYERFLDRHAVDPRAAVMFEDIARHLEPAAALGMTTVWVPGLSEWSHVGSDGDFIHHVADDLSAFLLELCED